MLKISRHIIDSCSSPGQFGFRCLSAIVDASSINLYLGSCLRCQPKPFLILSHDPCCYALWHQFHSLMTFAELKYSLLLSDGLFHYCLLNIVSFNCENQIFFIPCRFASCEVLSYIGLWIKRTLIWLQWNKLCSKLTFHLILYAISWLLRYKLLFAFKLFIYL